MKIHLNEMKELSIRPKSIKFLDESRLQKFHDVEFGNGFLHLASKAQATIEAMKKIELEQLKLY